MVTVSTHIRLVSKAELIRRAHTALPFLVEHIVDRVVLLIRQKPVITLGGARTLKNGLIGQLVSECGKAEACKSPFFISPKMSFMNEVGACGMILTSEVSESMKLL
ncbi:hypothetical protein Tcan_16553 [Toxocara canis]|uniref:Uncharacterized protein n=1 Tax=Toxocara canis TaxID=6265 RepID=A0A0B2VIT5_TOXCA|nr:hypothetical protein Tcan_16553 [Toxocara canis]